MNNIPKPILLAIAIILIVLVAKSIEVFNYPPLSTHQWRQSDCASYVKTFYRTGADVFHPAALNLLGKQGRMASEFPIMYYIAAKVQHIVGEHYWVMRGLNFLCYVIGLFALLACVKRWISDPIYAIFPLVLLASSPYYYYYAINFLPNVPAISFSFVGLYFYLKYDDDIKKRDLILGTLAFALATALKPTDGGILWLAFLGTWILLKVYHYLKNDVKTPILPMFLSTAFIGACIIGWIKYVNWYNDENGNHQNLIGVYPLWEMTKEAIHYTEVRILELWSNHFQQKHIVTLFKCMAFLYLVAWWWLDKALRLITLFLFFGVSIYCILYYKAFTDHDYYQLIYVVPVVFLIITIMEFFDRLVLPHIHPMMKYASYVTMAGIMYVSIIHNRNIQNERYTLPVWQYTNMNLFTIEPYLESIGIKDSDIVVSVPDGSPNISLNAMNRYGHTEIFNDENYNIGNFREMGAGYLIVNDTNYIKKKPIYQPYMQKKVGEYNGIMIYDIRK
jgi:hypothetical protein